MLFSHVRLVFIITSQSAFWPVIITSECVQDCLGKKGLQHLGITLLNSNTGIYFWHLAPLTWRKLIIIPLMSTSPHVRYFASWIKSFQPGDLLTFSTSTATTKVVIGVMCNSPKWAMHAW